MGFIQFQSVEHANEVADLLGMERPYSARIGDDEDPILEKVKDQIAMAKSVTDVTGDTLTISELLAMGK